MNMARLWRLLSFLAGLVALAAGFGIAYLELHETTQLDARVFGFGIVLAVGGALLAVVMMLTGPPAEK
jgi:hypothetical protein